MFLGISDAVFIFTAIVKPVRCHVASLGIPILVYIDDGLTGGASEKEASKNNKISNKINFLDFSNNITNLDTNSQMGTVAYLPTQ